MTPRAAWLTTLTLLVAMVTYVIAVPGSDLVLLLIPVTACIRYFAYQKIDSLAPQWFVAIVTFVAVIYAAIRVLDEGPRIEVLAEFVAVLAVIKSLERWSARDDLQMLLVAVFLVLAAIITSSTLLVGFMLVIFLPLLGFTAMSLQIEGAISFGEGDVVADRADRPVRDTGLRSVSGIFASAFLLIVSIAVVAFLLLPRGIGGDTFSELSRPQMGRATGFRSEVELGRGGLISTDQTVVMEVEIRSRSNASLGSNGKVFHLRGTALSQYRDGLWTRQRDESERIHTTRQAGFGYDFKDFYGDQQVHTGEADLKQIVHLTPNASNGGILFTVWRPIRIEFTHHQSGTLSLDESRRTANLTDSKTKLVTYEVLSKASIVADRSDRKRGPSAAWHDSEVVESITRGVLSDVGIEPDYERRSVAADYRAAAEIERWLSSTGGFSYTLDVPEAERGRDPIEWFLTEAKLGHCEYFASAMAAMCRSVGLNSRVITGYILGEYDTSRERYIVRRSNAHAWVEIETAPGHWDTFDPTPNVAAMHVPQPGNLRFLRRMLDAIDGFWLSSVVSFDETNQMRLLGIEHIAETDALHGGGLISRGKRIMRVVFLVLIGGLALLFIYRWYRRPSQLRMGGFSIELPHEALEARRRLLTHWERAGRPKPAWSGLIAHATTPGESELAEMLTSTAFGSRAWNKSDSTRSDAILQALEHHQNGHASASENR